MTPKNCNPSVLHENETQSQINNVNCLENDSLSLSVLSSLMVDSPPKYKQIELFEEEKNNLEFTELLKEKWSHYQEKFISNGAYSAVLGNATVREGVAQFITQRDSHKTNMESVFVLTGSVNAFGTFLSGIIRSSQDAVLLPLPVNVEYKMQIKAANGSCVDYKTTSKASQAESIAKAVTEAKNQGLTPKLLLVVNPGSITGRLLSKKEIQEILEVSLENNLLVIAEEKFQEVILGDSEFVSFKQALVTHPKEEVQKSLELISTNSISTTLTPFNLVCSYYELCNIDQQVHSEFLKLHGVNLWGNSIGQIALDLHVRREQILKGLSQQVRNLFDSQKERNKQLLISNYSHLKETLESTGWFELDGENNSFFCFAKVLKKTDTRSLAYDIEKNVKIAAEPGDLFGMKGWIRFDKFSKITIEQTQKLKEILRKLN